jgi:hypothetical protein
MQSSSTREVEAVCTILYRISDKPGDQEYRLDLCREHAEGVVKVLEYGEKIGVPEKRRSGRPPKVKAAATEMVPAPGSDPQPVLIPEMLICSLCGRGYKGKNGLGVHMRSQHRAEWDAREREAS